MAVVESKRDLGIPVEYTSYLEILENSNDVRTRCGTSVKFSRDFN